MKKAEIDKIVRARIGNLSHKGNWKKILKILKDLLSFLVLQFFSNVRFLKVYFSNNISFVSFMYIYVIMYI